MNSLLEEVSKDAKDQRRNASTSHPHTSLYMRQARAAALAASHSMSSGSLLARKSHVSPGGPKPPLLAAVESFVKPATLAERPAQQHSIADTTSTIRFPPLSEGGALSLDKGLSTSAVPDRGRSELRHLQSTHSMPTFARATPPPFSLGSGNSGRSKSGTRVPPLRFVAVSHALPPSVRPPQSGLAPVSVPRFTGYSHSTVLAPSNRAAALPMLSERPAKVLGDAARIARSASMPAMRKGRARVEPESPPKRPPLGFPSSIFGSLGSMAEVVEAIMGKRPEARRLDPAALNPALAAVVRKQHPDLVLGNRQTPGVGRAGNLYVPSGPTIYVFDEDGCALPPIASETLGLSEKVFVAACDPVSRLILVADCNGEQSMLVAFKPHLSDVVVRWRTDPGEVYNCYGLAVLPKQELVVASSYHGNTIQAYRLIDGGLSATAQVPEPTYLTADPDTTTVFCSSYEAGKGRVVAFEWRAGVFASRGGISAAGMTDARRPLAFVPPAWGRKESYLVVGSQRSPRLLVLALPSYRLVHTHELVGVQVTGLGCDAAPPDETFKLDGVGVRADARHKHGQTLIVLDHTTNDVLALEWPLPGMPDLV